MKRTRSSNESGAAAVEFALVLPLLFLLAFGIIEFGFIFFGWISMTHAAREGVRVYSLSSKTAADAEAAANDAASSVAGMGAFTGTSCKASPATPPSPGAQVQMTCSTTYSLVVFPGLPLKRPVTLTSVAKESRE